MLRAARIVFIFVLGLGLVAGADLAMFAIKARRASAPPDVTRDDFDRAFPDYGRRCGYALRRPACACRSCEHCPCSIPCPEEVHHGR